MTRGVSIPERFIRTALVLAALVVLFAPVVGPIGEFLGRPSRGSEKARILSLPPAAALLATLVFAGVELSFARRCLAGGMTGPVRHRLRRCGKIMFGIGLSALLLAIPAADWAVRDYVFWEGSRWWAMDAILCQVVIATLALIAGVLQLGIANRLAFRALERRRAGRNTRMGSDA